MSLRPVLLVEDNGDDVELTRRAFEANGIANALVVARDGVEALDYLFGTGSRAGEPPLEPAVVLLDLKLPRLDGFEVLRRLREHPRARRLRVVVLSTSKEPQDIAQGYELGAASHICKPVSFDAFVEVIAHLGRYWLRLNEAPPDERG